MRSVGLVADPRTTRWIACFGTGMRKYGPLRSSTLAADADTDVGGADRLLDVPRRSDPSRPQCRRRSAVGGGVPAVRPGRPSRLARPSGPGGCGPRDDRPRIRSPRRTVRLGRPPGRPGDEPCRKPLAIGGCRSTRTGCGVPRRRPGAAARGVIRISRSTRSPSSTCRRRAGSSAAAFDRTMPDVRAQAVETLDLVGRSAARAVHREARRAGSDLDRRRSRRRRARRPAA